MKKVLITGATKGIGLATSKLLTEQGYHVIGLARNAIADFPGELFQIDLADADLTAKVLNQIKAKHPHLYGIVNNVGGDAVLASLGQVDLDNLRYAFDMNVRAPVQIMQTFIEEMQQAKEGRVVNIVSRSSLYGLKDRTSYVAAKSALIGCTKVWALELAEENITVNAVAPGPVETELLREMRPVGSEGERTIIESVLLKRLGKPEEIASTIVFLLSEHGGFITGQIISVDGGVSL